jgi:membrane-bound lytic murein transglycosylase A
MTQSELYTSLMNENSPRLANGFEQLCFRSFPTFSRSALAAFILLASCSTTPEKSEKAVLPATVAAAVCPAPAAAPTCPVCPVCAPGKFPPVVLAPAEPSAPPVPEAARGRLTRVTWQSLSGWGTDDPTPALDAFLQGCATLSSQPVWRHVCGASQMMKNRRPAEVTRFFETEFEPYQVINADESDTGTITGYYEPLLRGSRTRTNEFRHPLYAPPQDLITVDLGEVYPDLKNRRLRGRIVGNKLVPYLERGDIEADTNPLRGLELVWVDDSVESFFLQIQGSGQILLPDGSRMRIGYADQNGHPFRSLAGLLIRRGEIKAERASMQGIKEWAIRNPRKVQQFMNGNPSYVFFKELPNELTGPIGTLGVPLTAERSIAVDQRVIPLGVPVFLSTTFPSTRTELNRLMVAQDTGGAINGGVRADFYWGFGDAAGNQAGKMKQQGRMWVLLPRGYNPNGNDPSAANTKAP